MIATTKINKAIDRDVETTEVPDLPPQYKRTEVGVIPEEWATHPLRIDISLFSGHHVLASNCNIRGDGTPYVTGPADFSEGQIKQTKFTTKPTTLCKTGDILITVKGSGSGTIVEADAEYCISRQLMAVRTTTWHPKFLLYSLLQNASRIKAASTGLIPGLSRSDILGQAIPLPKDPSEQRTIAEALSDVDALLGALDALITKKQAIKQAAMQQLLTGKTRLPGFSGEWVTKRLGEIGSFSKGRGIKREDVSDDGFPCVRYGELYTRYKDIILNPVTRISATVALEALPVKTGDLLFAGSGETAEEIGRCAAYMSQEQAYAGGDIVVLTPSNESSIYIGYLMNHPTVAIQKTRMGQGDAVVHISASNLAQVQISLPSIREQHAIATVLFDMDAEIAVLERHRDKTRAIKQGMMQQLLTGRVRLVGVSRSE